MDDHTFITVLGFITTALASIGASSGFWLYMDRKRNNRELTNKLLLGLAHDRIVCLSLEYIEREFITQDEHENLYKFLYLPYKDLGGNGSAIRLMHEVDKLPIFDSKSHLTKKIRKGELNDINQ